MTKNTSENAKELPNGWEWKIIGEVIANCQAGLVRTVSEVNDDNTGYPYIKMNVNFSDFKRQLIHYTVLGPCEFG